MTTGLQQADWAKWASQIAIHPITYWGKDQGAKAQADASKRGGTVISVANLLGQVMFLVVVKKDWNNIIYGELNLDLPGQAYAGANPAPVGEITPAGLTNPKTQNMGGGFGGGGGIQRGATSTEGLGVDVKSDFLGFSDFPPDTQVGPQHLVYGENVDGVQARGSISKRPGMIPVRPDRREDAGDLTAVPDTHFGRSINMLPPGFRDDGKSVLVLGYDNSSDLGDGTEDTDITVLRAVAVDIAYHSQFDISKVAPAITPSVAVADEIQFFVQMPTKYRNVGVDGVLSSVSQIVVVAAKGGYCLDRDIEDNLPDKRMVKDYVDWDGTLFTVLDENLTEGDEWFYTIWGVNEFEVSKPSFWRQTVVTPGP